MTYEYIGVGPETGRVVPGDCALSYAMERCGVRFAPAAGTAPEHDAFMDMLEAWYFSGNWTRKELEP